MPKGKGTYGSQVGRPSKKKYYGGGGVGNVLEKGSVDPFSLRNPEGVPAEQLKEGMQHQNIASEVLPESNAQERSQASPDVTEYKEGGKVEYVDVKDKRSGDIYNPAKKKKGIKGALQRVVPGGKSGYEKKSQAQIRKENPDDYTKEGKYIPKMRKSYTIDWSKRPGKGQFKDNETGEDVQFKPKKKDKK